MSQNPDLKKSIKKDPSLSSAAAGCYILAPLAPQQPLLSSDRASRRKQGPQRSASQASQKWLLAQRPGGGKAPHKL